MAVPGSAQQAVVLSGGGSRGLAHVGALIGIEERGFDADMVVGTSMGAVVGALYAAGYSPEEVSTRIAAVDWAQLFAPTPSLIGPAREIRHPMFVVDLDLSQLRLSRGLLGQWRINRALVQLLFDANARSRGDFDRLQRRYRAVATDLVTGDVVVLAEGDLARAARASMAVPGFFAPVAWDGLVLVDGGLSDNLPTLVARELGATYIIAVDVGRTPTELDSNAPFEVIGRAIDLMQDATTRDTIPPDALVLPDVVSGVSGTQFPSDPSVLFAAGLEAARRDLPAAAPTAAPAATPADAPGDTLPGPPGDTLPGVEAPFPVRAVPVRDIAAAPDSFSTLVIEAPDSAMASLAHTVFGGVVPGAYDVEAVLDAVDRLYTSGLVEGVWPRVEDVDDDHPRLVVRIEAPPVLSLVGAAHYENDRGGRGWVALERYQPLLARPALLSAAASLGGLERFATLSARVHPRSRPSLTWSVGAYVEERDVRFFPAEAIGATQVLRPGAWLALEMPLLLRDRVTTLAVRGEWIREENGVRGWSVGPLLRFASVEPGARVVGAPLLAEVEYRFGEIGYWSATLAGSGEVAMEGLGGAPGLRAAALFDVRAVGPEAPVDVTPALGDDHAVPGLRWGEIRGRARAVAGVDLAYPVLAGFARLKLRTGGVAPAWDEWEGGSLHAGGEIGGFFDSPIGTVSVGYALNTRGNSRFEVSLGRDF